jgi:capsule assembly protein Wzi
MLIGCCVAADYPQTPSLGSTYVPLDSWVYPAFDRLAALGYAPTAFLGLRPWTRVECARLVEEADDLLQQDSAAPPAAQELYDSLKAEFAPEIAGLEGEKNRQLALESVYVRSLSISGKPLTDGYHFAQTITNDFGRPYGNGESFESGASGRADFGPFLLYVRGEYQHAPSIPGYSLPVRQLISRVDLNPLQPPMPIGERDQFDLLDTYAGVNLKNFEVTFGKQSLWWGPSQSGPFLISDNIDPMYMVQINRVTPFKLPWIFHYFGPIKVSYYLGKLSQHHFPPGPYMHGANMTFKPTPNLEFGFSFGTVFAGKGHPFTLHSFLRSNFSTSAVNGKDDPGDRGQSFEMVYRVPGARKWVTLYTDSFVNDDPLPLAAPGRAAINPGLYFPRIPGIPKLDLRGEAISTMPPAPGGLQPGAPQGGQFIYWKVTYHDYYLNKGNLIGNWIGRDAKGWQAWSTYWFKPQNTVQAAFRSEEVDPKFIPGGGTLNDFTGRTDWKIKRDLSVTATLTYERWRFPVLSPNIERHVGFSFELNFLPHTLILGASHGNPQN